MELRPDFLRHPTRCNGGKVSKHNPCLSRAGHTLAIAAALRGASIPLGFKTRPCNTAHQQKVIEGLIQKLVASPENQKQSGILERIKQKLGMVLSVP